MLDLLETLEEVERRCSIAFVAGQQVEIPEDELNAALRRAFVVRAVEGDPARDLVLEETAVTRLAEELDGPERRAALMRGLEALVEPASSRPLVADGLAALLADADTAWRCFAAGRLAAAVT